jgi:hypothetical protein
MSWIEDHGPPSPVSSVGTTFTSYDPERKKRMQGWKKAMQMMTRKERVNHILNDWAVLDMGLASWLAEVAYDRRKISLSFLFVACVGHWSKTLADHWTTSNKARAMVSRDKKKENDKKQRSSKRGKEMESPCDIWQSFANPFQVHGPFDAPMSCASRSKYVLLVGTGSGLQTCISVLIGLAAQSHARVTLVAVTSDQVAYENHFGPLLRRLTDTDLGIRVLVYCGWNRMGEDSAIDLVTILLETPVAGPVAGLMREKDDGGGSSCGRSSVAAEAATAFRMQLYEYFSVGGFSSGYTQSDASTWQSPHDLPLQTSIDLFVTVAQSTIAEFKTNTTWAKIEHSFCEAYLIRAASHRAEVKHADNTQAGQVEYPDEPAYVFSRVSSAASCTSNPLNHTEEICKKLIQATKQILPGLLSGWSLSAPGVGDLGGALPGVDDLVQHVDDRELQPDWEGLIEKKQGMDKVSYSKLLRALRRVKAYYDSSRSQLLTNSSMRDGNGGRGTCCASLRRRFGLAKSNFLSWTGDSISFEMFEAALLGAATELSQKGRLQKESIDASVAMHVPHLVQPRADGDPLDSWDGQLRTRPSFPDFAGVWRMVKQAAVMDWTRVVKNESAKRILEQQGQKKVIGRSNEGGGRKDSGAVLPHIAVFYSGAQIETCNALKAAANKEHCSFTAESFNH